MDFKLEICVDSLESSINAQKGGADRIELCDNLPEGGTTPSYGTIMAARKYLDIAVNVIIRPRGGDFLYSDIEFETMISDIEICKKAGVNGIVIGILTEDGNIDITRTRRLVELAHPMPVTFHRAFDMCPDPFKGLEDIISTGAKRILTSGMKDAAPDGAQLIGKLVRLAGDRIIIMPGAGLTEDNIGDFARTTRAGEYHLTGRKLIESGMKFRRDDVSMGLPGLPEFTRKVADPDRIRKIVNILKAV